MLMTLSHPLHFNILHAFAAITASVSMQAEIRISLLEHRCYALSLNCHLHRQSWLCSGRHHTFPWLHLLDFPWTQTWKGS